MNFDSFTTFYPYFLRQHASLSCRRLHFLGTCGVFSLLILFFFTGEPILLLLMPVVGYGLASLGDFMYEKTKPLALSYPWYSLLADFRMFWDILAGRVKAF